MPITLTDSAARRVAEILREENLDGAAFRVMVEGGGCMGFQYQMGVDDKPMEGDQMVESAGARVVVDGFSVPFLRGAVLNWVEDLAGERFEIQNPNASSSCGCGTSFAAVT